MYSSPNSYEPGCKQVDRFCLSNVDLRFSNRRLAQNCFSSVRSPMLTQSTEEYQQPQSDAQLNTDEYEIIDIKTPQPKEVIDLKVVDESESNESHYIVVRLTKKLISIIACLAVFIAIMLIVIGVSVHYVLHL